MIKMRVKKLHFCTKNKIKEILEKDFFKTIRTGFIPNFYSGESINILNKLTGQILCNAYVKSVIPIQFKDIDKEMHKEEIERYKRKFDERHWFFLIELEKNFYPNFI